MLVYTPKTNGHLWRTLPGDDYHGQSLVFVDVFVEWGRGAWEWRWIVAVGSDSRDAGRCAMERNAIRCAFTALRELIAAADAA